MCLVLHVNSHSLSIYSIKERKIFVYLGLFFYISELRHSTDHADKYAYVHRLRDGLHMMFDKYCLQGRCVDRIRPLSLG